MTTPTVLITGFEPFGGETVNSSALAVGSLAGRVIGGRRVTSVILPCVFDEARGALVNELRRARPEVVICVGQAGGRDAISLERVAINVDDASIPDNAGAQPIDRPVVAGGPVAYWSTLPLKATVAAMRAEGLPAEVSQTAGTFVCNHVFYGLMHTLRRRSGIRGGFVHVPYLPDQAARSKPGTPCLPLDRITRGLEIAIGTALTIAHDVGIPGGATH